MRYRGLIIRPPSEAGSYILQVSYGCSHNACTFCPTYKGTRFAVVRPNIEAPETAREPVASTVSDDDIPF